MADNIFNGTPSKKLCVHPFKNGVPSPSSRQTRLDQFIKVESPAKGKINPVSISSFKVREIPSKHRLPRKYSNIPYQLGSYSRVDSYFVKNGEKPKSKQGRFNQVSDVIDLTTVEPIVEKEVLERQKSVRSDLNHDVKHPLLFDTKIKPNGFMDIIDITSGDNSDGEIQIIKEVHTSPNSFPDSVECRVESPLLIINVDLERQHQGKSGEKPKSKQGRSNQVSDVIDLTTIEPIVRKEVLEHQKSVRSDWNNDVEYPLLFDTKIKQNGFMDIASGDNSDDEVQIIKEVHTSPNSYPDSVECRVESPLLVFNVDLERQHQGKFNVASARRKLNVGDLGEMIGVKKSLDIDDWRKHAAIQIVSTENICSEFSDCSAVIGDNLSVANISCDLPSSKTDSLSKSNILTVHSLPTHSKQNKLNNTTANSSDLVITPTDNVDYISRSVDFVNDLGHLIGMKCDHVSQNDISDVTDCLDSVRKLSCTLSRLKTTSQLSDVTQEKRYPSDSIEDNLSLETSHTVLETDISEQKPTCLQEFSETSKLSDLPVQGIKTTFTMQVPFDRIRMSGLGHLNEHPGMETLNCHGAVRVVTTEELKRQTVQLIHDSKASGVAFGNGACQPRSVSKEQQGNHDSKATKNQPASTVNSAFNSQSSMTEALGWNEIDQDGILETVGSWHGFSLRVMSSAETDFYEGCVDPGDIMGDPENFELEIVLHGLQSLHINLEPGAHPHACMFGDLMRRLIWKGGHLLLQYHAVSLANHVLQCCPPSCADARTFYYNSFQQVAKDELVGGENAWRMCHCLLEDILRLDNGTSFPAWAADTPYDELVRSGAEHLLSFVVQVLEDEFDLWNQETKTLPKLLCWRIFWMTRSQLDLCQSVRDLIRYWVISLDEIPRIRKLICRLVCVMLNVSWRWARPNIYPIDDLPPFFQMVGYELLNLCKEMKDSKPLLRLVQDLWSPWHQHVVAMMLAKTFGEITVPNPVSLVHLLNLFVKLKSSSQEILGSNASVVKCEEESVEVPFRTLALTPQAQTGCHASRLSPSFQSNVNKPNCKGERPLHIACKSLKNLERVRDILNTRGLDVNAQDYAGWTALHEAAQRGHLDYIQMLLDYEPVPAWGEMEGKENNDDASISSRQRINVFLTDVEDRMTALHDTVLHGHMECARLLLEYAGEALLNVRDKRNQTAIDLVIEKAKQVTQMKEKESINEMFLMLKSFQGSAGKSSVGFHNRQNTTIKLAVAMGRNPIGIVLNQIDWSSFAVIFGNAFLEASGVRTLSTILGHIARPQWSAKGLQGASKVLLMSEGEFASVADGYSNRNGSRNSVMDVEMVGGDTNATTSHESSRGDNTIMSSDAFGSFFSKWKTENDNDDLVSVSSLSLHDECMDWRKVHIKEQELPADFHRSERHAATDDEITLAAEMFSRMNRNLKCFSKVRRNLQQEWFSYILGNTGHISKPSIDPAVVKYAHQLHSLTK